MTASTETASTATIADVDVVRAIEQFVGGPAAIAAFWA